MNRYIFILIFLLSFTNIKGQEPQWQFLPSLGINMGGAIPVPLSEAPKDAKVTLKIKPSVGFGVQRNINQRLKLGAEINYQILSFDASVTVISQAFWSDDRSYATYFSGDAFTSTELQFIEIPITAQYNFGKRFTMLVGPYGSFILRGHLETEGKNGWISANKEDTDNTPLPGTQNTYFNFNDDLDSYDIGVLLGYHYALGKKLNLWGKINVGFKGIFKPEFNNIDYDMNQFRFSTGLSYVLWTSN